MTLNLLAIEAAVGGGSLCIHRRDGELIEWVGSDTTLRSEDMLVKIDELLKKAGLSVNDLDHVAVSAGPGGFTGIRIGLATARGLAKALHADLCTVSLLRVAASRIIANEIVAVVPMGQDFVCFQDFQLTDHELKELSEPRSISRENFDRAINDRPTAVVVAYGSLAKHLHQAENVIDLGDHMARYIADYCLQHEATLTKPLFVSKSQS